MVKAANHGVPRRHPGSQPVRVVLSSLLRVKEEGQFKSEHSANDEAQRAHCEAGQKLAQPLHRLERVADWASLPSSGVEYRHPGSQGSQCGAHHQTVREVAVHLVSQLMSQQADALLIVKDVPERQSNPQNAPPADADLSVSGVEIWLNRDHVDRPRAQICPDSVQHRIKGGSIARAQGQGIPLQSPELRAEYEADQQQRDPEDKHRKTEEAGYYEVQAESEDGSSRQMYCQRKHE